VGQCQARVPPRDGDGEAMQGCSWPHPLNSSALGDSRAGKELPGEAMGSAEGCRPNKSHMEGTLLHHPSLLAAGHGGPAFSCCAPGGWSRCSRLATAQLRPLMFAHSCLLMCLVTESCQDRPLLPLALAGLLPVFPAGSMHSPREQNQIPSSRSARDASARSNGNPTPRHQ